MSTEVPWQAARLWPRPRLPLDPSRSHIALLPADDLHSAIPIFGTQACGEECVRQIVAELSRDDLPQPIMSTPPSRSCDGLSVSSIPSVDFATIPSFDSSKHAFLEAGGSTNPRDSIVSHVSSPEPAVQVAELFSLPRAGGVLALLHGNSAPHSVRTDAERRFSRLVSSSAEKISAVLPTYAFTDPALSDHLAPVLQGRHRHIHSASHASGELARRCTVGASPFRQAGDEARKSGSSSGRLSVPSQASASSSSLPPLDFEQLLGHESMSTTEVCTARRSVDSMTAALSQVRPFLFVTGVDGIRDVQALRNANVTHILNTCGVTAGNFHEGMSFQYMRLCAVDGPEENMLMFLTDTSHFIDSARAAGGAVAVHCHRGISRSCAVVMAYLIMSEGLSVEDALADIRNARPIAEPNSSFMDTLFELESQVKHGLSKAILYRVQHYDRANDPKYLVGAPVRNMAELVGLDVCFNGSLLLDERFCWILAHPRRNGVEAVRGPAATDEEWVRCREIASQMAARENNSESMFAVSGVSPGQSGDMKDALPGSVCQLKFWEAQDWSEPLCERFVRTAIEGRD